MEIISYLYPVSISWKSLGHSEARNILQASSMLNLVGNRIIKLAIEMRLAKETTVRNIQGIPFLMVFKFRHFD